MKITSGFMSLMLIGFMGSAAKAQNVEGDTVEDEWIDQTAETEEPQEEIETDYFFDKLAPHGDWLWTPEYGWVWHPRDLPSDWRPFTDGSFTYTSLGWTWVSDAPYGWAVYHYGSWAFIDHIGWVWVPGTVWSPARVMWRYSDLYVGWSPILAGYDYWYGWEFYPINYHYWSFLHWDHFCGHDYRHHYVSGREAREVFRHTYYPRRCRESSDGSCYRGPSHVAVGRIIKRDVPVYKIENTATRVRLPSATTLQSDRLEIFRPRTIEARKLEPKEFIQTRTHEPRQRPQEPAFERQPSPGATIRPQPPERDTEAIRPYRPVTPFPSHDAVTPARPDHEAGAIQPSRPVTPFHPSDAGIRPSNPPPIFVPGQSISPSRPTISPSRPTISPSRPTISPSRPSISPSRPTISPSRPSISPSQPTISPSRPSISPSRPSFSPSHSQSSSSGSSSDHSSSSRPSHRR